MKPTEAAALLTIAAAFDNRKPDADQAKAWAMALDDLRFEDCREVIVAHYRKSRDWLMPSDVFSGVMQLRRQRLTDYGEIPAPTGINPDDTAAYNRASVQIRRAIADGTYVPPEVDALTTKHDVIGELGHVGRSVTDAIADPIKAARDAAVAAKYVPSDEEQA